MIASRLHHARLLLPLLLVGCDDRSEMLEPQVPSLAAGVVGSYELTVVNGTNVGGDVWEVPGPAVYQLHAHIAFPNGTPVTKGTVLWQLLVDGRWDRLSSFQVDLNGNATFEPGVGLPSTLRFKYSAQGSGVKSGISNTVTVRLAQ